MLCMTGEACAACCMCMTGEVCVVDDVCRMLLSRDRRGVYVTLWGKLFI